MKKKAFKLIALAMAVLLLAGCSPAGIPLAYDAKIHEGGIADTGEYNQELFYRNDALLTQPDPFVLYITDEGSTEYGYYYLYATNFVDQGYKAYRSRDMVNWQDVSAEVGHYCFLEQEIDAFTNPYWAPELIYDEETDKYYLFYSASATTEWSWEGSYMRIGVAIADEPYGPFIAYENNILIDEDKANAAIPEEDRGSWCCIDASPFYGADGEKYMVFTREMDTDDGVVITETAVNSTAWGIRMIDWQTPDYTTLTRLTCVGYLDTEKTAVADYESASVRNEGPHMYVRKHDDGTATYYLTTSINGLDDYTVVQAISDKPLGPFRKLTEEEGGILLANDHMSWDHIKGTGHHCFVQAGNELMIVYHQQENRLTGGSWIRALAMDRITFVDNGRGQEVMVANGPTWSLQPQLEIASQWRNIAPEATVKANKGENVEALTDGALSMYKKIDFVKEFEANAKNTTITLTFDDYREVKGLMVYNSKWFEKAFMFIDRVEFDFKNEDVPDGATAYIENLPFDWQSYVKGSRDDMRPGGSAVAVFAPMLVKEIRITFKLPVDRHDELQILDEEGYVIQQDTVAVSEIVVLGK